MQEFLKIIKKKGIIKTIVYAILIIVMLLPMIIFYKQVIGSFKGTCVASTFDELKKCQSQGRYTKIKTQNIYDVGYNYVVDGEVVGKFLDVDLNGNVILTLADTATADELLNKTGEREISGHFTSFDSQVFKDTLQKIEEEYIERFTEEAGVITEEETKGMFYKYMLNQYDGKGFPYVIPVIIVGIIIILLGAKVIEGIQMIIKPEKFIIYGKKQVDKNKDIDKASFEFQNGPYLFENKYIKITNNYIFDTKGYRILYHKVNDAVWMYENSVKQYGIFEAKKQLIVRFKDHSGMILTLDLAQRKKVSEILRVKNPKIVKGYNKELEDQYRKDPNHLK